LLGSIPKDDRPESRKIGTKKLLGKLRGIHKTQARWKKQTIGQSGRKLKNRLAKLLFRWLDQNLAERMWDPFFQPGFELGCFCGDLKEFAPRAWERPEFDGNWQKVIEATKPAGIPLDVKYKYFFEYYWQWFSSWYQLCMPFPAIRKAVCERVRIELRRTAWRRFGSTVFWTMPPPFK
jgi:hypothetical protein